MSTLLQSLGGRGFVAETRAGCWPVLATGSTTQTTARFTHRRQDAAPPSSCSGPMLARGRAMPSFAAPAAAPSVPGPSTCTSRRLRRWAPIWNCATAMSMRKAPGGAEGDGDRISRRLRRRHGKRADGGHARQGHHGAEERRARARDRRSGPLPAQDGRPDRGRGHVDPQPSRASTGCTAQPTRWSPTGSSWAPTCWRPRFAGGEVELLGGRMDLVAAFAERLDAAGVSVEQTGRRPQGRAPKNGRVRAVDVVTAPFPASRPTCRRR